MSLISFAEPVDSASVQRDSKRLVPDRLLQFLYRLNGALHSDFCPSMNRWVYWMKQPFWCLVMALVLSVAVGIFVNTQVLLLTGILIVLAMLGTLLPWVTVRGLECRVRLDQQRGRAGNALLVRLRIRNRFPWPAWGLSLIRGFCADSVTGSCEGTNHAGVSLARIPGWSTQEFTWTFVPDTHGQYPLHPPELETGFPFGLIRCACSITSEGRTIVWPAALDLAGVPDSATIRCHDNTPADNSAGDFGDLLGTRFFRHGDSLRRIHWAQTARQQKLIVCERQAMARSQVRLLVDVSHASHPQHQIQSHSCVPSLELVIRTAAAICESLYQQQCRVELQIGTERPIHGDSLQGFRKQMDSLSTAVVLTSDEDGLKIGANSSGSVTLLVTTPYGLSRLKNLRRGVRLVCVGDGSKAEEMSQCVTPWLRVSDRHALTSQFPQLWKGACRVG